MDANALTDAAPTNLQYSNGAWRIVNNEIGPWPSVLDARAGGISGGADGLTILGNHIHDISRPTNELLNHGIYIDSFAQNVNIGYNWIYNITGGNLIQLYDSVGAVGTDWPGFANIQIHHNWLEKCAKHALNLADSTLSGRVWNNIVIGTDQSGICINTEYLDNLDVSIAFNTFYDNARASIRGIVTNSWGTQCTGTIQLANNIIAAGPNTLSTSAYYVNDATDTFMKFANNLFYDHMHGWATLDMDARGQYADPLFNHPPSMDLSLQVTSPAVDQGDASLHAALAVSDDFTSIVLRDSKPDLGGLEYSNSTSSMPPTSAPAHSGPPTSTNPLPASVPLTSAAPASHSNPTPVPHDHFGAATLSVLALIYLAL